MGHVRPIQNKQQKQQQQQNQVNSLVVDFMNVSRVEVTDEHTGLSSISCGNFQYNMLPNLG